MVIALMLSAAGMSFIALSETNLNFRNNHHLFPGIDVSSIYIASIMSI
jgi:hypothetical protein